MWPIEVISTQFFSLGQNLQMKTKAIRLKSPKLNIYLKIHEIPEIRRWSWSLPWSSCRNSSPTSRTGLPPQSSGCTEMTWGGLKNSKPRVRLWTELECWSDSFAINMCVNCPDLLCAQVQIYGKHPLAAFSFISFQNRHLCFKISKMKCDGFPLFW